MVTCSTIVDNLNGAWVATPVGELPAIGEPPVEWPSFDAWVQAIRLTTAFVPEWNVVFAATNIASAVQVCTVASSVGSGLNWLHRHTL